MLKFLFDFREVRLFDVRIENPVKSWKLDGEVEKVLWNPQNKETFMVRYLKLLYLVRMFH